MVEFLRSDLLSGAAGVRHAFFTRKGGASKGIYSSLNVGVGSRDRPGAVAENRARAAAAFQVEARALISCYQIHSATVIAADRPWAERPEGDAMVTRTPGLMCGILTADCAPVLIADPEAGIVGAAHAGWKGALAGVVGNTVQAMAARGGRPERMVAAVGPCIGPASYEVGEEFVERFRAEDATFLGFFAPGEGGKALFDLPRFVIERLRRAGVGQAEWIGRDTFAEPGLFFSNRRAFKAQEPDYGRLLSAIMLTPQQAQ